MSRRSQSPREAAARALCRREGNLENITFEGRPMWESFLPVVDVVLSAIAGAKQQGSIDEWISARTRGAPVSAGDLLSLLLLLPKGETVMISGSNEFTDLVAEMVSVGEKSERLCLEATAR